MPVGVEPLIAIHLEFFNAWKVSEMLLKPM